jgi:asparagine synthetase B (glutamine-hydrolysing)
MFCGKISFSVKKRHNKFSFTPYAVYELVGVFGLAVWDRERQILWLGRDRTGGRTLYYTTNGTTRWIASNLRSLSPYHSKEDGVEYQIQRSGSDSN